MPHPFLAPYPLIVRYGVQTLLDSSTLALHAGERVGLVVAMDAANRLSCGSRRATWSRMAERSRRGVRRALHADHAAVRRPDPPGPPGRGRRAGGRIAGRIRERLMLGYPRPGRVAAAAANFYDATVRGGLADLRRMPAALISKTEPEPVST